MSLATVTHAPLPVVSPWPDEVAAVLNRCPHRRYARGEVIAVAGERDVALHLVLRGRVALTVADAAGGRATRAVVGPGRIFGIMALLRPSAPRTTTAVATDAVDLAIVTRTAFDQLRQSHPAFERFVFDHLARVITALTEQVSDATSLRAEQRVVRQVLALAPAFRSGARVVIKVRQQDLAWMAGTTRPTVNQVLRALEHEDIVRLGRSRIDVLDIAALAARAD